MQNARLEVAHPSTLCSPVPLTVDLKNSPSAVEDQSEQRWKLEAAAALCQVRSSI